MKPLYKSKTFWFNALTVLVVFASYFGYTPNQEVADMTSQILLGLAPLANIILRLVTSEKVSM